VLNTDVQPPIVTPSLLFPDVPLLPAIENNVLQEMTTKLLDGDRGQDANGNASKKTDIYDVYFQLTHAT
jgi:hypothetical protein